MLNIWLFEHESNENSWEASEDVIDQSKMFKKSTQIAWEPTPLFWQFFFSAKREMPFSFLLPNVKYSRCWVLASTSWIKTTSRERCRSAPFPRLKIAKEHQSVNYLTTVPEKPTSGSELARPEPPRGTFLTSFVAKHQKIEREPFGEFFRKKSHNAEKNWKGAHWDISTSFLSSSIKTLKRALWGKIVFL